MESLGATELAVLYDFFDDNDVIGDFILTPRETPLTVTELSSQLKNFAVKREFASILSQFDSKQLALRTFGTVSLLRKVAAKYSQIKRKLAEDDGAASVIELQDEVLRLNRDQQFHSSYWIEKMAEVQRERNAAVAQMRSDFALLMEEREKDISSLRSQVQTLKMELETAQTSRKTTASRSQGPRPPTTHVPPEWQTVITVVANDNLAFQAPPFVRMDPPQDEDDAKTKESGPPAPDAFLDPSRGASTTKFGSKSSQLGKRASGSQSPKSHKKPAPDGVQELPSEWVGSVTLSPGGGTPAALSCPSSGKSGGLSGRLEGSSSGHQAPDGRGAGVPGCFGAGGGSRVPPHMLLSGRPHHHAPVHDAVASFGLRSVDEVPSPPVLHGGFGGANYSLKE
ncbi:unnamed protein product [Phytophthora fragariaefolia]|uniref:Unnamed protein product n=1 Tax=Phytophthora fragariaefolia TaxID=1490495 RepID=A0A9W6TPM0_9STRA|nr:unnamed protein product [Phytophthora fragariaefolia]